MASLSSDLDSCVSIPPMIRSPDGPLAAALAHACRACRESAAMFFSPLSDLEILYYFFRHPGLADRHSPPWFPQKSVDFFSAGLWPASHFATAPPWSPIIIMNNNRNKHWSAVGWTVARVMSASQQLESGAPGPRCPHELERGRAQPIELCATRLNGP